MHASAFLSIWKLKRKLTLWSTIVFSVTAPLGAMDLVIQSTSGEPGATVQVPLLLTSRGATVAALVFEVEYDFTRLEFEGSSGLPAGARNGHTVSVVTHTGEKGSIGLAAYDAAAPVQPFPDGLLTSLRFRIQPAAEGFAVVRIATRPAADAADSEGRRIQVHPPMDATGIFITRAQEVPLSDSVVGDGMPAASTPPLLVPVVARRTDENGWRWRSVAMLFNPTHRPVSVLLTLLPEQEMKLTRQIRLAPSQHSAWEDLVGELFDQEEAYGAVMIRSSSTDLIVHSTLIREREGESAAHSVPVVVLRRMETIYLPVSQRSEQHQATLSLVNPGNEPVTIRVELIGSESSRRFYLVEPGRTLDQIGFLDEIGAQSDGPAVMRIEAMTPGALIYGFTTTVHRNSESFTLQTPR